MEELKTNAVCSLSHREPSFGCLDLWVCLGAPIEARKLGRGHWGEEGKLKKGEMLEHSVVKIDNGREGEMGRVGGW